jgi:hypothetical protein
MLDDKGSATRASSFELLAAAWAVDVFARCIAAQA